MRKVIKSVGLIAMVFMFIAVNSCTKDSSVSNNTATSIHKFNIDDLCPDGVYPFVLPDDMQPYQYAVYASDEDMLFEYIQSKLDNAENGDEKGYCILSFDSVNALFYYGFITETSIYYDPTIWIIPCDTINVDNGGGNVCTDTGYKHFDDRKAARAFAMEKAKDNHYVSISKDTEKGGWLVHYTDR